MVIIQSSGFISQTWNEVIRCLHIYRTLIPTHELRTGGNNVQKTKILNPFFVPVYFHLSFFQYFLIPNFLKITIKFGINYPDNKVLRSFGGTYCR